MSKFLQHLLQSTGFARPRRLSLSLSTSAPPTPAAVSASPNLRVKRLGRTGVLWLQGRVGRAGGAARNEGMSGSRSMLELGSTKAKSSPTAQRLSRDLSEAYGHLVTSTSLRSLSETTLTNRTARHAQLAPRPATASSTPLRGGAGGGAKDRARRRAVLFDESFASDEFGYMDITPSLSVGASPITPAMCFPTHSSSSNFLSAQERWALRKIGDDAWMLGVPPFLPAAQAATTSEELGLTESPSVVLYEFQR